MAGALTFFPPEPPFYKFERIDRDGHVLPDEPLEADIIDSDDDDDDGDDKLLDICDLEQEASYELEQERDANFSSLCTGTSPGTTQYSGTSGLARSVIVGDQLANDEMVEQLSVEEKERKIEAKKKKKSKTAAAALTERTRKLRRRGRARNLRDGLDAAAGVTYRFVLDLRLSSVLDSSSDFSGSIEAVKIGPHPKTKTYIAALIYRVSSPPPLGTVSVDHHARRWIPNTKTLIFSHGNATDMGAMHSMQSILARNLHANIIMYDYSGFGHSGGVALEANTYRDIMMVYDYALQNVATNGDGRTIVAYGQSVGSGPCCYLASKRKENLGGLILHSPFTSGMRVLTSNRALACLDIYPNIERIRKVQCPVMIIHGQKDEEVDCSHGVAMYQAVPPKYRREPWWVPHRGHNDITEGSGNLSQYLRRLRLFLEELN